MFQAGQTGTGGHGQPPIPPGEGDWPGGWDEVGTGRCGAWPGAEHPSWGGLQWAGRRCTRKDVPRAV